jgi:hypothetical protein
MNKGDDLKTFWAYVKDSGKMPEIIVEVSSQAQVYWSTYGGYSLESPKIDIKTGKLTTAAYHRIEV